LENIVGQSKPGRRRWIALRTEKWVYLPCHVSEGKNVVDLAKANREEEVIFSVPLKIGKICQFIGFGYSHFTACLFFNSA
jgi:hypothetical protein